MENASLIVTNSVKADLSETAKWGKFISIVGFVSVGFLLLLAISLLFTGQAGEQMTGFSSAMISGFYFVMAIIYIVPVYFLFRYSNGMKKALNRDDQSELAAAFGNLKKLFVFLGIVTAITLLFYTLGIIAVIAGEMIGSMI